MDAEALRICRGEKGMVLVFLALALVVLLFVAGLAIDFSYRHVAKAELQNAADSAALAGATLLPRYTSARSAAIAYAGKNRVVGNPPDPVSVLPDDVTLGHYDKTASPAWVPGGTPINAVQVWARRDQDTTLPEQQSKIPLFFGKLFGLPQIGVAAMAIAQRLPHAGGYILLSHLDCSAPKDPATGLLSPPLAVEPGNATMGWTSLTFVPTGPGANITDFICKEDVPDVDACSYPIYTTGGTLNVSFQDMEATFYDPEYDQVHKTFAPDGTVQTWTVIVPVTDSDPTIQPGPLPVWGYATIRIVRACGAGNGNPCHGDRYHFAPAGVCGGSENDVVIDQITCYSCGDAANNLGAKAFLVK